MKSKMLSGFTDVKTCAISLEFHKTRKKFGFNVSCAQCHHGELYKNS